MDSERELQTGNGGEHQPETPGAVANRRILIWGTGNTARRVTAKGVNGEIVGYICSKPKEKTFQNKPVYSPGQIDLEYDAILVAVLRQSVNEIFHTIQTFHLPLHKICFMTLPMTVAAGAEENLALARQILSEENLAAADIWTGEGCAADFVRADLETYNAKNTRESFRYRESEKYFIYQDRDSQAGSLGSYFFQDVWAAQWIYQRNPYRHFDIGSRIDGFIGHLLAFRDRITIIDIRPQPGQIPGVDFVQADATNLDGIADGSIESLSALSSLEHFGLGRYGDPIDPEACFKAFQAIQKKLMPGGCAYISVPVGREHVEFNAHRIFYARTIVDSFDGLELVEYSVTDGSCIRRGVSLDAYDGYGEGAGIFGLFCFQKRRETQ